MIGYRHEYWRVQNRFTAEACARVQEISAGVPRDIVLVCGYAYSIADDRKLDAIGPEVINEAISTSSSFNTPY